ncbi:MAG TPA: DNRLRE domain-containing protein, partial [Herpetosiphonaceae bacterium]
MRNRISRHLLTVLLGLYVLSTIPFAAPSQAQSLDDAAARFRQQRNAIAGRRDLPAAADSVPAPAAPIDVDQAARLEQLRARWAGEQTRELPSPRVTDPSRIYLPGMMHNASIPVLAEHATPADQAVRGDVTLTATTATVYLQGDTYVAEADRDTDFHQEERMLLGADPDGKSRRIYINGDMPALPPGMTADNIINSTLRLYQYNDLNGGSYRVRIFPTNDPWDVPITWSEQPGRTATPFDTPLVSAGTGHKSFDLTDLVRGWYAGGTPTFPRGIAIIMSDENERGGSYTATDCVSAFCSDGTTLAAARPVWTVEFGPPIASRSDLRMSESLSFAPNNRPPRGSDVTARFSVGNTSGREVTVPRLRVSMRGPSGTIYNFPSTPSMTLAPGQSYT